MTKYSFNEIPGFFTIHDYNAIKNIVSTLPNVGHLVEVGSLFGRSIVAWDEHFNQQNKHWQLTCIDKWVRNLPSDAPPGLLCPEDYQYVNGNKNLIDESKSRLELFNKFTYGRNINSIMIRWTKNFIWDTPVNVVFEDSKHTEEYLSEALPYWWERLTPRGVLCGHDYNESYPGVKTVVDKLAAKHKKTVLIAAHNELTPKSTIWAIYK